MATGADDAPRHHVLPSLTSARQGLAAVNDAVCWSMSDDEARTALAEATRLQAIARAAYLKLLAESAARDVPRPTTTSESTGAGPAQGAAETCSWLAAACTMSAGRVRADLREATALDPDTGTLRAMGTQLAAGAVTPEHTTIGVRALTRLPAKLVRERRDEVDDLLTEHASTFDPVTTAMLGKHLLAVVAPDRADHHDTEADQRRELSLAVDSTGMGVLRGQIDPATTAHLKAMLDHLSAPRPRADRQQERARRPGRADHADHQRPAHPHPAPPRPPQAGGAPSPEPPR